MKNFEKAIEKIKVPNIEHDPYEAKLRASIFNKYFDRSKRYNTKFYYAAGFASVLLVFTLISIFNPSITYKINQFAFNDQTEELPQVEEVNQQKEDFLRYTSIHNPNLSQKLDPNDFEEDRAYLIRKYTSNTEGSVMVVSEFKQDKKKSNHRISY